MTDGPVTDEKTTLRDLRASPLHELEPGTVLAGRYRIVGPVGAGGMGAVYEAEQIELQRRVAIKLVRNSEGDSFERLRREALGASSVQSPHVVSVFDFHWEEGEPPFLVMELLAGRSLESLMEAEGALPFSEASRLASQVLDGLGAAHRVGLVHRDVKPANIWLVPTMTGDLAKLLDFGLVKSLDDAVGITARSDRILGTRAYLAPEQIHRLPTDPRSDLHAVGVVLWEMITGRRIWQSKGPEVFAEIAARSPENLSALLPDVPRGLAEAVARALAKDPEGRFRDAAEMHEAITPYAAVARASVPADDPYETPAVATEAMPAPRTLPSATDPSRSDRSSAASAPRPPLAATMLSGQGPTAGPTAMHATLRSGQAAVTPPAPAPLAATTRMQAPSRSSQPAVWSAPTSFGPASDGVSALAPPPRGNTLLIVVITVLVAVAVALFGVVLLVVWLGVAGHSTARPAPSAGAAPGATTASPRPSKSPIESGR